MKKLISKKEQVGNFRNQIWDKVFTLTSNQVRIFVHHNLDHSSTLYNVPSIFKIDGRIDVIKAKKAFDIILRRHESLRTSFILDNQLILQKVNHESEPDFQHEIIQTDQLEKRLCKFVRPFDLSNNSLLRVGLFTISDESHVLIIDMHHILTDGRSVQIILRDFIRAYEELFYQTTNSNLRITFCG